MTQLFRFGWLKVFMDIFSPLLMYLADVFSAQFSIWLHCFNVCNNINTSAFGKGPARIETSGPQFFGYLHFGHLGQ